MIDNTVRLGCDDAGGRNNPPRAAFATSTSSFAPAALQQQKTGRRLKPTPGFNCNA
ncbi:hypothetical protein [Pararhizobium arenae]|uniref:hypothetical protein n=1 Tax=Pararhizobium arenae TaxID=1856850 RepID=UPI001300F455|nr:hypothetical protein [Pararhizobium arenae]